MDNTTLNRDYGTYLFTTSKSVPRRTSPKTIENVPHCIILGTKNSFILPCF